jgi:BirA family transcriptional regulator, biotin operon repressor / biotin---[acetyl-CoA-carboxylase] ligase
VDPAAALASALTARGGPRLAAVEWHEEIGSTSDRVKDLARAGAPAWTVVLADRQSGGRGREGRAWASPPGGLYLSVLLRPEIPRVSLLPLAAGVAVAEAVRELGVRCELKWPNDVLVGGRKLAGILAEASSGGTGVEWIVLGIGVNVATSQDQLPEALRDTATSLVGSGAPDASATQVAAATLARLAAWCEALREAPARVVAAWRSHAVPWWGEPVVVRTGGGERRGRLAGIDDAGALVLETEAGERVRLVSGEVSRLRAAAIP